MRTPEERRRRPRPDCTATVIGALAHLLAPAGALRAPATLAPKQPEMEEPEMENLLKELRELRESRRADHRQNVHTWTDWEAGHNTGMLDMLGLVIEKIEAAAELAARKARRE